MTIVLMGEMEQINLLNNDCNTYNDAFFCSFYYKAVKNLLNIDNKANVSYLLRYIRIFNKYYDQFCQVKSDLEDKDEPIIKLLKDSLYYRVIYILRNATIFSSAIAFHFQNTFEHNQNIFKRFIVKKQVKICSIGGYSAPDIVAVITFLKSIGHKSGIELDFRVTVIDSSLDWKNTCISVLSCLEDFHQATWKINFVQSNLANKREWTEEMLKAVQGADVVTMVRYFSTLRNKMKAVEMICDESQSEVLLFIMDSTATKHVKVYFEIAHLDHFHLIHVELCDYHTLEIEAVKHLKTLYQKSFGDEKNLRSNLSFYLFVSVWVKASTETESKHKENLQSIFQNNVEKYNPKQGFLSANDLTKWKNDFTKEKEAAGWNAKNIKKIVLKEERKRSNMFGEFIRKEKGVHSLQKQLLSEARSTEEKADEVKEGNEDSLEHFLIQKKQCALVKRNAYLSALRSNKCN